MSKTFSLGTLPNNIILSSLISISSLDKVKKSLNSLSLHFEKSQVHNLV